MRKSPALKWPGKGMRLLRCLLTYLLMIFNGCVILSQG